MGRPDGRQNGEIRPVKITADFIKHAEGSVLIECGFLSNEEEAKKLSQKEYQKMLSFSIICGIIEYMNTKI